MDNIEVNSSQIWWKMLPILKRRQDVGMSAAPDEIVKREPDEEKGFDMLDAIVDDMLLAFEKKDKSLLYGALESLIF